MHKIPTEKLLQNKPPPGFLVGDDGPFVPKQVLRDEKACIDRLHRRRTQDGQRSAPFSLAFSGGGIRAAAFQSGVLWRLAQMDRLKDVEYFAAVSGGGYIASAFASHVLGAEPPEEGNVKQWYLEVVAKTLCRMQENAGDFVRDFVKGPTNKVEGSGCLPRIFDLPLLLGALFLAMAWNPFILVVAILTPLTTYIEFFFGGQMRAAFCSPPGITWITVVMEWTPILTMWQLFWYSLAATFVIYVIRKVLPGCKLRHTRDGKWRASWTFLLGYNAQAFFSRFTVGILFVVTFILFVPALQVGLFSLSETRTQLRSEYCIAYILQHQQPKCSDLRDGIPWYEHPQFLDVAAIAKTPEDIPKLEYEAVRAKTYKVVSLAGTVLLTALVVVVCCLPIVGAELFTFVIGVVGPLFLGTMLLWFVQFRVFGPITPQRLVGGIVFDQELWDRYVKWCLRLSLLLLPFYEEMRSVLHLYYRRSLQKNFFYRGKDVCFHQLAEHPYCPFVLMTGTSSDFQPPHDVDNISELSFSALHCGSLETGYVTMPEYRSLSKCTALTGAGCLDAITLSMTNALSMRFWLQVLNLSWGDYLIFEGDPFQGVKKIARFFGMIGGHRVESYTGRFLHRLPSIVFCWTYLYIMNHGWHIAQHGGPIACGTAKTLLLAALYLVLGAIFLSFFAFLPVLDYIGLSPVIRQIHQATRHCYIGDVDDGIAPPRMLYVTDGGVKDCTALVQLMQRRRERILLVLAAADPDDELGVLRAAMEVASSRRLGSFFDPEDPRKDVKILLERFKRDKSMPYLHIGIVYGWELDGGVGQRGDLFVIKLRLPPERTGEAVQPPLTEEEVWTGRPPKPRPDEDAWKDLTTDSLGPFGCCDCCHTRGLNCGPKFPHGTVTGYLYISPQWCSSLSRLAYDSSEAAIKAMTSTV